MNVTLTVKSIGGVALSPTVEQIFDTEKWSTPRAYGVDDTSFFYAFGEDAIYKKVIVEESFETVKTLLGTNGGVQKIVKEVWGIFDATAGKAIGAHNILDPVSLQPMKLPDNAIVQNGLIVVGTTFTSAGDNATIAIGVPVDGAAGLRAAVAISSGTSWDAGNKAVIPVGTAATAFGPTTDERNVQATVAVEALTAGVFRLQLQYTILP